MIRVGIIAPEPALLIGLRTIFTGELFEIAGEAFSLNEAQIFFPRTDILIVTTEVGSPEEISLLLRSYETIGILLLVAESVDLARYIAAFEQRPWGMLNMDCTPEELRTAISAVAEGLVVGSHELLSPIVSDRKIKLFEIADQNQDKAPLLTGRESEVLHLLAKGFANKQIALELGVSERTVKFHIAGIFSKLGVSSRTEAVSVGLRQGMITL